jgi:hypothetical protein
MSQIEKPGMNWYRERKNLVGFLCQKKVKEEEGIRPMFW